MGYFNNSNGLRLNINRGWKAKTFSLRNESLSIIFFQRQFLEFLEVFMNARKFHRRGMVLSHIVTRVRGSNGLEVDVFIYDPSVSKHTSRGHELLVGDGFLPKRIHQNLRGTLKPMNKIMPQRLRNAVEEGILLYRRLFYDAMGAYIKSKFSRIYPKLGLKIRFVPLRARMINAEFLTRFFLMKFQYKRDIVHIINPVSSRLLRRFGGVRIECRGRFTKRQRAGKFNFRHGTVSLNNFSHRVDYSQVDLPLKYGACSIKLWLSNRLASKEYGSEQGVTEFNSFNIMRLPIQRQELSKYALSLGKGKSERAINFSTVRVPLSKVIKVGNLGEHRLYPRKRNVFAFTDTSFYNRRVRLGKQLVSDVKGLSKSARYRFLSKLLVRKDPSWHRKWAPSYKFLTARELNRSVEKEANKIKRDSAVYHTANRDLLAKLISSRKYGSLKKPSKDLASAYKWFPTRLRPAKRVVKSMKFKRPERLRILGRKVKKIVSIKLKGLPLKRLTKLKQVKVKKKHGKARK